MATLKVTDHKTAREVIRQAKSGLVNIGLYDEVRAGLDSLLHYLDRLKLPDPSDTPKLEYRVIEWLQGTPTDNSYGNMLDVIANLRLSDRAIVELAKLKIGGTMNVGNYEILLLRDE